MVENNINFASDAEGFIALNPGQKVNMIPVFLQEGNQDLSVKILPTDAGSKFDIESCSAVETNLRVVRP
jgi:hypothetical protein